jgi:hypothetical protein
MITDSSLRLLRGFLLVVIRAVSTGALSVSEAGRCRLFLVMLLSNSSRSDDVPSGRRQRSWIGVDPIRGPPGFAARVDADVLPTNSRGISPRSDPQLLCRGRSLIGTHRRAFACDHIDGSLPRTLFRVLE